MGGQACIIYGAAEFSRDTDIAILAEPDNLRRLQTALSALEARVTAVPPFEPEYLARGHAVHFECGLEDLVNCKKTRRHQDWPMVRRLVEPHYPDPELEPTPERFRFWLRELRTPALLAECVVRAQAAPSEIAAVLAELSARRKATAVALQGGSEQEIGSALADEETRERAADEAYWRPRIQELERLRHAVRSAMHP